MPDATARPLEPDAWAALARARHSVRDFRPDPVPEPVLREVLGDAITAPSWSNTQPYRLAVASGPLRDRISGELCARFDAGMRARRGGPVERARVAITRTGLPDGDFRVPERYPDDLQPARVACGRGLYEVLGIDRGDLPARDRQMRRNFEFFGAPTVVFLFVHGGLREYAVLDAGVLLQTLMLAAHARGLGTCAQGALAIWAGPVRSAFEVPPQYRLICGVSLGYPSAEPVNAFRPGRAPLEDVLLAPRDA
ncbi:MAG: nitroreductase [Candidatus Nanopelagicales bacterium]|jgi:nitroreductase|nr:nitroreductase [Candidatus Nanopelagicales bacterium]